MESQEIIDLIQRIREKNNRGWMDILRLAFKYAPEEAGVIMRDIAKYDKEISALNEQLGDLGDSFEAKPGEVWLKAKGTFLPEKKL